MTTKKNPATTNEVMVQAARLLSQRERSAAELRKLLGQRGHPPEAIESCLGLLRQNGLQSDSRTREALVRRLIEKGASNQEIQRQLSEQGLEIAELPDEQERALALLLARRRQDDTPPKAARYLASKGYDEETIHAALASRFSDAEFGSE